MCGSMADIQSAAAEIRRGKKKKERRKNKRFDENIMVCHSALFQTATIITHANHTGRFQSSDGTRSRGR